MEILIWWFGLLIAQARHATKFFCVTQDDPKVNVVGPSMESRSPKAALEYDAAVVGIARSKQQLNPDPKAIVTLTDTDAHVATENVPVTVVYPGDETM